MAEARRTEFKKLIAEDPRKALEEAGALEAEARVLLDQGKGDDAVLLLREAATLLGRGLALDRPGAGLRLKTRAVTFSVRMCGSSQ